MKPVTLDINEKDMKLLMKGKRVKLTLAPPFSFANQKRLHFDVALTEGALKLIAKN